MNIDEINNFLENDFSTHITNILRIKNNFKNDNNEINKKKIELLIKFINVFEMKCSLIDSGDNENENENEGEDNDNNSQNVNIDDEELNKDSDDNSDNGSNSTESLSDCEYDDDDNFKDELTNIYKRARLGLESARDNKGFSIEKKNSYSLVE